MEEDAPWWTTPSGQNAFFCPWAELASSANLPVKHDGISPLAASDLRDAFIGWCLPAGESPEERASKLQDIRSAAVILLRYLESDPQATFAPDIGHAPSVLAVLGCKLPGTKEEGREARRLLTSNYDADLFLRLVEAAAGHESDATLSPMRGRKSDEARHLFVLSLMNIYEMIAGKTAGLSKKPGGSHREGPAPRFLQAYCAHLCEAGAQNGVGVPAEVRQRLVAVTADLHVAGQWVEQAIIYRRKL